MLLLVTAFFRQQRYRNLIVLAMMASWLFMLVSATCVMPQPLQRTHIAEAVSGCDESSHADHNLHAVSSEPDCTLKLCPDSQSKLSFGFKIDQPQVPLFLLCLVWLSGWLLDYRSSQIRLKRLDIALAKPVPLFYRFCILLN